MKKTETKNFLENYLNTQLILEGVTTSQFAVQYFDSSNNQIIQIADVFANFYYSQLRTSAYSDEMKIRIPFLLNIFLGILTSENAYAIVMIPTVSLVFVPLSR